MSSAASRQRNLSRDISLVLPSISYRSKEKISPQQFQQPRNCSLFQEQKIYPRDISSPFLYQDFFLFVTYRVNRFKEKGFSRDIFHQSSNSNVHFKSKGKKKFLAYYSNPIFPEFLYKSNPLK